MAPNLEMLPEWKYGEAGARRECAQVCVCGVSGAAEGIGWNRLSAHKGCSAATLQPDPTG